MSRPRKGRKKGCSSSLQERNREADNTKKKRQSLSTPKPNTLKSKEELVKANKQLIEKTKVSSREDDSDLSTMSEEPSCCCKDTEEGKPKQGVQITINLHHRAKLILKLAVIPLQK